MNQDTNDRLKTLADDIRETERRLDEIARPTRERLAEMGPAGLYAVAAAEYHRAHREKDRDQRRLHLVAARAAETLADQAIAAAPR